MRFSTSKIKCYKACRKLYFFKYIEKLICTDEKAEALVDGTNYHQLLEDLYNTGEFILDIENNPKVSAMASAYKKYIYPQFRCHKAESNFEKVIADNVTLTGRFDGVADDGNVVEHKTTSSNVDEEYVANLQWDEQVLNYMLATGTNIIYYTVCKKPTLRPKVNETPTEFYERCVAWYDEETDTKLKVIKVIRSNEEIEQQKKALIYIANEMESNEQKEHKDLLFYRNPSHCMQYGRKCEFAPICLDYKPDMVYVNFKKQDDNTNSVKTNF